MSKKDDIYLKVIDAAFVTIPDKNAEPSSGRILVKVEKSKGEDLIGLYFDDAEAVDSCLSALHRIKKEITKDESIHPILKGPTDGNTH